jgi:hypothetical protein
LPASSYVPPVYQYQHAAGRCSVTGGYVYRGSKFQELYGKYFFADYCTAEIQYLESNGSGGYNNVNLGDFNLDYLSSFGKDSSGELYFSGVNNGVIYKIISSDCTPVATINTGRDTITDCGTASVNLSVPAGAGFDYVWTLNGDTLSTTNSHTATQEGLYVVHVTNQTCSNSDSVFVDFTNPLVVTFTGLDTLYCINHSNVNLLPNYLGGTFSGAGISGATFSPAAAGAGNWIITYSYTSSAGCTDVDSQFVHVDACSGIEENTWLHSISVSPNPSGSNGFYLNVYSALEKNLIVNVTDMTGRIIMTENLVLNAGNNSIFENLNLAGGVYVIHFSDEKLSLSKKLIIQR